MRAIVMGDGGALGLEEVATPQPGPGQARVRIHACAVNRADILQRHGRYPAPADAPQNIPGLEIAGEVDAIGDGTTDVRIGDRVFGIVSGGAYAEAVVVHARTLAPIPLVNGKPLGFVEAAAIPEAFITAYDALVSQGSLSAGEIALVHAVGSGVGTAAVQIAHAIGARAIGTARTKDKLDRAEGLGLAAGILVEGPRFADRVRELVKELQSSRGGVDVALELVGGAYVPESLSCLAERGRLILVGLMAGTRADIDLGIVLRRRLLLLGTVLRARPLEEKIVAAQLLARHIAPLVSEEKLVPIIDRILPLDRAAEAHDRMTSNESYGKIVLQVAQ